MTVRSMCVALLLVVVLAGCDAGADADADAEVAPKPADFRGSGLAACPAVGSAPSPGSLAAIALPCMDGSGVDHPLGRAPGRPTVVNLWASWCPPCAKELPAFERLHERSGGTVSVLGVVTEDSAKASVGAANDLHLTFPQLYDRKGRVRSALGRIGLPITAFLDASGAVAYVYNGPALDDAGLRALVTKHLSVTLP